MNSILLERAKVMASNPDELCPGRLAMVRRMLAETKDEALIKSIYESVKDKSDDYAYGPVILMADAQLAGKMYERLISEADTLEISDVKAALSILPFYMCGETVLGKKEHYQDIIVKFDAITKVFLEGEKDTKKASRLLLALVSTIDLMSQQLFEHYMALVDNFKAVLRAYKDEFVSSDEHTRYVAAFAVNMAEDLKIILAEKYDAYVDELLK